MLVLPGGPVLQKSTFLSEIAEHWIQFCIRVVLLVAERFLVTVYIGVMHAEYCPSTDPVVCERRVGPSVIGQIRMREMPRGFAVLFVFK